MNANETNTSTSLIPILNINLKELRVEKQKQPFIKFTLIDGEPLYFSLDTVIESISGHKKGDEQHTVIVTKNIQYEVQGSPEDILVALYSHPG